MKQANWVVVATLVVLSGMAAAQLHSGSSIVAQVPFEFVAANMVVPAGECVIQPTNMNGKNLMIRNAEAKVALFSPWSPAEGEQRASDYALVFNHYGDRYFLSGIRLEGSKIIYRLPESKAEAELRAQNISSTEETLVASLK
jgi:hypothetical protein